MDAGAGAHRKTKWLLAGTEFDDGNIVVLAVEKAQCQILSVGRERGRIIGIGARKIDKRHWRRRRRICCRRDQIKQNQPELLHRSEEHTSELQSLMRISYAVFCLKKQKDISNDITHVVLTK